jgi:hypothetical protein
VLSPLDAGDGTLLKVERRRISTGSQQGDLTEIMTGLNAGERVVRRGAGFLSDGDVVREAVEPDSAVAAQ